MPHGMIPCPAFADLNALIDGSLSLEEELVVQLHLEGCAACHGRVAQLTALKQAVGGAYERPELPEAVRRAVTAGRTPPKE